MKKISFLAACLLILSVFLSACTQSTDSTIKYERKLGKYFEAGTDKFSGGTIDLSEGPKLKYNANLGPKDLNFDFKIVNPY